MGKYRYLFKNIGVLTLSQFATKFISFFLVPLYTSVLATSEYGVYDLLITTIGVLLPIFTLNIQDAVLRFSLDDNGDKGAVVSVGVRYMIVGNLLILVCLLINKLFDISEIISAYSVVLFFTFFIQSFSGVLTAYVRGNGKITDLSISSVVASVVTICLNILFLAVFKWGIRGYFLANIFGPFIQCIFLIIRSAFFSHVHISKKYKNEAREMTAYSKPLIANGIAWWVNSAADRYVVTFFCGLAENGIYSIAGKIPSILNIFQSIFNQAWTLSAVKDYDPEDSNGFFAITYKAYNCLMIILCSVIILFDKVLARFLYVDDFYSAWKYVPWLTLAVLFGGLSGYLGGIFAAVKDSKIFSLSSVIAAATNIILNMILIPLLGATGAAIATTISYAMVWAIRCWCTKKFVKLKINIVRHSVCYALLIVQTVVLVTEIPYAIQIEIMILFVLCVLCVDDIKSISKMAIRRK